MGKSGQGEQQQPFDRVSALVVGLVLAAPLLLFGGVHPNIQWGLLAFQILLFLLLFLRDRRSGRSFVWHPLAVVPMCLAAIALLQVVGLPSSWLEVLSPLNAGAVRALDGVLDFQDHSAPVTLDPVATRAAAARWWFIGVATLTLLQALRSRRIRRAVPWMVLAMAVFTVVVGIVQSTFSVHRIYGLFVPWHGNAQIGPGGPFVNGNHASQLCLMAAMVCLAMASSKRRKSTYALLFGVFLMCVAGIMLSGGRGALLVVAIGSLIWAFLPGRGLHRGYRLIIPLGLLTLDILALLALRVEAFRIFFQWERLLPQFELSKLRLLGFGFQALVASPWVGLGADALTSVQMALIPLSRAVHMAAIENDYLQILVDFGVVGTMLVLAVAGLLFWSHGRKVGLLERPHRQAWWLVIAAVGMDSLVSFSIQVPALLLPLIAIFLSRMGRLERRTLKRWSTVALSGAALGMSILFLSIHPSLERQSLPGQRSQLVALLAQRPLDGRYLWTTAVRYHDLIEVAELERLADRAAQLAGNDAYLLAALGEFWLARGSVIQAWELFDRAWDMGVVPGSRIDEIIGQVQDVDLLVSLCVRLPDRLEAILRTLALHERFADLMQTALSLPDSPMVRYFRTRAAWGLGERELAAGFAEQAGPAVHASSEECTWIASTLRLVGNNPAAVDLLSSCLESNPDEPRLIIQYTQLALETRDSAEETRDSVDAWLDRLNLLVPAHSAYQRPYQELRATTYARDGRCQAAQFMLGNARGGNTHYTYVPDWVWRICPETTR